MIWRVQSGNTVLDFGSQQAAIQLLDCYAPHIREKVVYKEITAAEITDKISAIKSEISRQRRDSTQEIIPTVHLEWLLSRIEFYEKALPYVQDKESNIATKEAGRVGQFSSEVNEVWKGN